MRLSRLCERAGVAFPGGADDVEVNAFAIDHRKVAPGTVFGAFQGYSVNGEDYIPQAIASGAIGVIARAEARVDGALHFADEQPRRLFARLAGAFFRPFPGTIAAVTGTNGKTSTAEMTRQLWRMAGERAASIGTLGVTTPDESVSTGLTTPDIVTFLSNLRGLAREGTTHVVYEASSHGLSQYRNEGVPVKAAAFTNFSRDHLDYHATMEDYFEAKMRLVEKVLDPDGTAVIWADDPKSGDVISRARKRGVAIMTVGKAGEQIVLVAQEPTELGQEIVVRYDGSERKIALPLIGAYQAANALTAAGLALATGISPSQVFDGVARLQPVAGRLQRAVINRDGAPAYVDYAHTPDALEAAIAALRPHCKGELTVVFGAGGDRDQGKRIPMGKAAMGAADKVIVTDDNPRGEDPQAIRASIMRGAPGATEIGDRREAICAAIAAAKRGDIVLIAGKGHEQGQVIGAGKDARVLAFDDVAVARECAGSAG